MIDSDYALGEVYIESILSLSLSLSHIRKISEITKLSEKPIVEVSSPPKKEPSPPMRNTKATPNEKQKSAEGNLSLFN